LSGSKTGFSRSPTKWCFQPGFDSGSSDEALENPVTGAGGRARSHKIAAPRGSISRAVIALRSCAVRLLAGSLRALPGGAGSLCARCRAAPKACAVAGVRAAPGAHAAVGRQGTAGGLAAVGASARTSERDAGREEEEEWIRRED